MSPRPDCIVGQINDEIAHVANTLMATGLPERAACDIAFDAVIAALTEAAPHVLAIYRAAITVRHPAIFAHLN